MMLIFEDNVRTIRNYKCLYLFLMTWYITGCLIPQHYSTLFMGQFNGPMLTTILVLMSGILTHLRYHTFIETESFWKFGNQRMHQYIYCRFIRFLPTLLFAIIWAIFLDLFIDFRMPPNLLTYLSVLTLTSSWSNFVPLVKSTTAATLKYSPALLFASLYATCWLLYPHIGQAVSSLARFTKTKTSMIYIWAVATILIASIYTPLTIISARHDTGDFRNDAIKANQYIGSIVFFVNPLFKLPAFLVGVLTGQLIITLGWNRIDQPQNSNILITWVLPYIGDLMLFISILIIGYDPSHGPSTFYNISDKIVTIGGLLNPWTEREYSYASQFFALPLLAAVALLLANPHASRSLTSVAFAHDAIYYVLPGRSAFCMSLLYLQALKSSPLQPLTHIVSGVGFFYFLAIVFSTALLWYYYVFEPLNVWMSIRVSAAGLMGLFKECPVHQDYKIWQSPNYDRFNLDDDKAELNVYKHLSEVQPPNTIGWIRWFREVFINIHACY